MSVSRGDSEERALSETTCVVCGAATNADEIEDTNGWRWFSDGRGGLLPLCASCPVPEEILHPDDLDAAALGR